MTKKSTSKIRIYDLAKSLIEGDLPDKERKVLQSAKSKRILEICKQLGVHATTASSSIPEEYVGQILDNIDKGNSKSPKPQKSEDTKEETASESKEEKKVTRVIRRVVRKSPEPEQEEEVDNEEVTDDYEEESEVEEDFDDSYEEESTVEDPVEDSVEPEPEVVIAEEPVEVEEPPVKEDKEEKKEEKPVAPVIEEKKEEKKSSLFPKMKSAEEYNRLQKERRIKAEQDRKEREAQRRNSPNKPANKKFEYKKRPGIGGAPTTPQPSQKPGSQPYRVARPPMNQFGGFRKKGGAKKRNVQKTNAAKTRNQPVVEKTPEIISLSRQLTIHEFAEVLKVNETEIIKALFMKGIMRTINQTLDKELLIDVAKDFNCEVLWEEEVPGTGTTDGESLNAKLKTLVDSQYEEDEEEREERPPVVTIMGHVDHGKTTLLDAIRKAKKNITDSESGGITQHIGAYQVVVKDYEDNDCTVTFLDTPGHEAFTALRARGAQVTDIAILVVSADDGVMPQTIEAISHAKAAKVPIIVAVNKIDKPEANPNLVLGQLAEHELVVEDYGGEVVCSQISAKQGINLDDLLSKITLVADVEINSKLQASAKKPAVGAVIEAALSSSKGTVATLLVQNGTLRKGDCIVAGVASGRVRAIFNDEGNEIDEAPPATPVQILGLDVQPQAGDIFEVMPSMAAAKEKASKEKDKQKQKRSNSLESISTLIREGAAKELPVVIKSDVQGSAEAIASELSKLSTDEVSVRIIHCAAGAISESDVNLAATAGAIIVNFNSIMDAATSKLAQDNQVSVYTYNVIYHLTDAVKKALSGLLDDEQVEIRHGAAEVREVFSIGKTKIAGCSVLEGKMVAGGIAKIMRGGKELVTLSLTSLKRFKDNVKEVQEGYECGIFLEGFHEYEEGDIIESWGIEMRERTLG